ncbi:putative membrane protein [Larkinella arboricola]|uniref:Putative membrane protein n=1 Tax=Larkinella arboricola TaxID=643671 RepID=A0A327WRE4_LARAB|nr:bestrophin family ion channel [Larkinella arboricola]RAJ93246.1 putative membrane protein [Larkinella arboricola]
MLLKPDLRLSRVVRITWKVDLWMIALCTGAYLLEAYILRGTSHIPNNIPALLATTLAFFIGFNNNQAYSRWWEARTIWGALVNDSRSWTRSLLAYTQLHIDPVTDQAHPNELAVRLIRRNLSFLYALKQSLRNTEEPDYQSYLEPTDLATLTHYSNIPAGVLDLQVRDLQKLRETDQMDGFAFLALNELLVRFSDSMGRCERIKNTLFPVTYVYFTRVFIWLMIFILTIDIAEEAGMWSIGLGWLIGFVFHVTHLNGLNLINPFDGNPASIPLDSLVRTIEINVMQTLHAPEIPKPIEAVDGEYIL